MAANPTLTHEFIGVWLPVDLLFLAYAVPAAFAFGLSVVFGRGGEEALALAAAAIPFRIVPGISAGIGGLAYAGIPVTHRDVNSAVAFVTGHDATGEVPDSVDWAALAKGAPVIVLYMALTHLDDIARRLIAAGRTPGEAVAIVSKATTEAQRVVMTSLGEAAAAAAELGVDPRYAMVVGDSVWDLLAARRAGALGVGLLSGGYGREELERAGAYRVYADQAEMLGRIDELGVRAE